MELGGLAYIHLRRGTKAHSFETPRISLSLANLAHFTWLISTQLVACVTLNSSYVSVQVRAKVRINLTIKT